MVINYDQFCKKYPVRDTTKIKKFIDKLNIKLKNDDFELVYKNCINCKNNTEKILFNNDRYGINLKVVMCQNCGFVYLNPRINEKSLTKLYESDLYRDIYHKIDNYRYMEFS